MLLINTDYGIEVVKNMYCVLGKLLCISFNCTDILNLYFQKLNTQEVYENEEQTEESDFEESEIPTAKEALLALKVVLRWKETVDKYDETQPLTLEKIGAMIRTALCSTKDGKSH